MSRRLISAGHDGPEGPYTSPFASSKHFIIRTIRGGAIVWAIVQNGQQPADTTLLFPRYKEAKAYMDDNGFVLR